jgi:hypothetical protein
MPRRSKIAFILLSNVQAAIGDTPPKFCDVVPFDCAKRRLPLIYPTSSAFSCCQKPRWNNPGCRLYWDFENVSPSSHSNVLMPSCKENADETLRQHAQTSQDLDIFTNRRTVNAFDEWMQVCVGVTPTKFGVAAQGEQLEGIADTKSITDSNPPSGVSNPVKNQTEANQDADCIGTDELETTVVLVPSAHFKAVVASSKDNEDERFG